MEEEVASAALAPVQDKSVPEASEESEALGVGATAVLLPAGLAFALYFRTAAPALTWSHHGADGGDLLAAAVSGGVPHPSGYPLYTMLLEAWLAAGQAVAPFASPARLGNLLSAILAALSVGVTVCVAARLAGNGSSRWWIAVAAASLWAVSPLLWSQSLITEVYTLHVLLAAVLVWVVLSPRLGLMPLGIATGLGMAHHLTFILLLPAAAYLLWRNHGRRLPVRQVMLSLVLAAVVACAFYVRIPIAATGSLKPPPVNWGYADNAAGFWWLVSGQAYRAYLADQSWIDAGQRLAAWARALTVQYTPLGLLVAAIGLTNWDRERPDLRTFSLLWVLPLSLYTVVYATRDSEVYLLPASWLMVLWVAAALRVVARWLADRSRLGVQRATAGLSGLVMLGVLALIVVRAPELSLRTDTEAMDFLAEVGEVVEPGSIVVSSGDAETFAVWYAAWATGDLLAKAPGSIIVNDSLYQFDWYRRLLGDLYPEVAGIDEGFQALLDQNAGLRPIYFVERLDTVPDNAQESAGSIWRYTP